MIAWILMVCISFHGGNEDDLQTTGLRAEEAPGREEREKPLMGLTARGGDRNAVTLSVSLLTCGEEKAFIFYFHGASRAVEAVKTWVSEAFLPDFCYIPWGRSGKSV